MTTLLLDTGPLVALLDAHDHLHRWSREVFASFRAPLVTCEPVLAEACYLLRSTKGGQDRVMELVQVGALVVQPMLPVETPAIRSLLSRYEDQGISLADACLVRLSEIYRDCRVVTADVRDFRVYRRHGRQTIPLVTP